MADVQSNLHLTSSVQTQGLQSSTTVLASNASRGAFMIQNQDNSNPLKIRFGTGASATVYDVVLKSCTSAADGTGGFLSMEDGSIYTGLITCFSAGTPSYTVFEIN